MEILKSVASDKVYNIIYLIYRAQNYEGHSKDYEFSRLSTGYRYVPARFRKSKSVGAVFRLSLRQVPIRRDRPQRCDIAVWRRDDADDALRSGPDHAVHSKKWSWLKAWAMKIARHRGTKKAIVALARRLAVIMHRIWVDGSEFRWTREATATA